MGKSCLFLLAILIGISTAQKINFNDDLGPAHYLNNVEPFSAGVRKVEFNLEITNGKASVLAMSRANLELYRQGEEYWHYTFLSDQPFSSLHVTTELINFEEPFYILVRSENLLEKIRVVGYIHVQTVESSLASGLIAVIITSPLILIGIISFVIYRLCCRAKPVVISYVAMTSISEDGVVV